MTTPDYRSTDLAGAAHLALEAGPLFDDRPTAADVGDFGDFGAWVACPYSGEPCSSPHCVVGGCDAELEAILGRG